MRTQTVSLYTFNELSETAKEKAREWYRNNCLDYEWYDLTIDEWKEFGAMLGIEIDNIYFSGFCHQGSGACFTGNYSYLKGWKETLRKETGGGLFDKLAEIGQELQRIQKEYFYGISASVTHSDRYSHEYSVSVSVDFEQHNNSYRNNTTEAEKTVTECLRDFMRLIYSSLESEYDI